MKAAIIAGASVVMLAFTCSSAAEAAPPVLYSVGHENMHVAATFSVSEADRAIFYLATRPDRAPDGTFLYTHRQSDLTTDEIASGVWLDELQTPPGFYYVMLETRDFHCDQQPSCSQGFSNVLTLHVPTPRRRYTAKAVVKNWGVVWLRFTATWVNEEGLPYRVCWRLKSNRRKCRSSRVTIAVPPWQRIADDTIDVSIRGMRTRTTFTWYVRNRAVATTTTSTRRP